MTAPVDNLVRALADDAVHLRAAEDEGSSGRTLFGHFAVFDRWTEIDSVWEGRFLERVARGAFDRTMTERRDKIRVLYDHGMDPQLGNKPLGPVTELREDKTGAYYEVDLLETSYNDDFIIPAVRAGTLGASFRFSVKAEEWVEPRSVTRHNPAKLPERTITDADLYEFGPVTFPAYESATAGLRSLTDDFIERLLRDPRSLARFTERVGLSNVEKLLESLPPSARDTQTVAPPPVDDPAPSATPVDVSAGGHPSLSDRDERAKYARLAYVTREGVGRRFT